MQHFVSNYSKWEAEKRGLDLTFATIYPKQLIAGTNIAGDASSAYAAAASISADQFMSQWDQPLTPETHRRVCDATCQITRRNRTGIWCDRSGHGSTGLT